MADQTNPQSDWPLVSQYRENPPSQLIGLTAVKVLNADPRRRTILFANFSANLILVSMFPTVATSGGIPLAANFGAVSLLWWEDGRMVQEAWFAAASGANSQIYILEGLTA
jgi:hypothetical protein